MASGESKADRMKRDLKEAVETAKELGLLEGTKGVKTEAIQDVFIPVAMFRQGLIQEFPRQYIRHKARTIQDCFTLDGVPASDLDKHAARIAYFVSKSPETWDPILLGYKGKGPKQGTWRLDGLHRVIAAHLCGYKQIRARMLNLD